MRTFKYALGVGVLIFAAAVRPPPAIAGTGEPDAATLVQAVRKSENWIHEVNSLYIRIESKWTRTPEGIAAGRAELQRMFPDQALDPNRFADLKPSSTGTIAFAFDQQRLWCFQDFPGESRYYGFWDGKQRISHEEQFISGQERYYIDSTAQDFEPMFENISWLRSQPHSFWWAPKNVKEHLKYYGAPEDFMLIGRSKFRGISCYILECEPRGYSGGIRHRLYVGAADGRLYGKVNLAERKIDVKHWTLDYEEVAQGCWFPMTQGYELYELDSHGVPYLRAFQEQKFVEVSIDKGLSDDLFKMEFKEGVQVNDRRSGHLITYIYKAPLIGKALPSLTGIKIDFDLQVTRGNAILFCFFDMNQRPSRNCLLQLSKRAQELKAKDVVVIAIQGSKVDENTLNEWIKTNNISFPVGMIRDDSEKIRFAWGVKSLPWLILTDKQHVVVAEGFALAELDEKLNLERDIK